MATRRELVKADAKGMGTTAAVSGGATLAAVVGLSLLGAPIAAIPVGIVGFAFTAKKTYDWLKFRGKWGIRF